MRMTDRPARRIRARSTVLPALALLAALALAGCAPKAGGGFQMPPMPVEVADVASGPVSDRFRAVGTVEADETVRIVNEISAVVRELPFAEGQPVAKGDMIARLDDSELGAEASRADALRDQARTNHERVRQLFDQQAASQQELDDVSSALKVAGNTNNGAASQPFSACEPRQGSCFNLSGFNSPPLAA